MNTAYRVAGGWQRFRPGKPPGSARSKANLAAEAPAEVKPYPHGGVEHVPICWLHQDRNGNPDVKASKRAAEKMKGKTGFGIADFGAAYPSNHSKGEAIDMDFSWPTITMRDGNGHSRTIPSGNSRSSRKMWAVGASFGVIKQRTGDPPHWSLNGR